MNLTLLVDVWKTLGPRNPTALQTVGEKPTCPKALLSLSYYSETSCVPVVANTRERCRHGATFPF